MSLLLLDNRGHLGLRKSLADIGTETTLVAGDIAFPFGDNKTCAVEAKEIGDLLSSISSGRLYEQCRNLSSQTTLPCLLLLGIFAPTKEGYVRMENFHTKWKYSQVDGILLDIALKGFLVMREPSVFAASLAIRSLFTQLTTPKQGEIHLPKVFGFRKSESTQLKMLCAIDGVNLKTARELLAIYPTPAELVDVTPPQLQATVPHIGPILAERIWDAFHSAG